MKEVSYFRFLLIAVKGEQLVVLCQFGNAASLWARK